LLRRASRIVWRLGNTFSRVGLDEFLDRQVAALNRLPGDLEIILVGAGGVVEQRARELRHRLTTVDIDPAMEPDVVADVCQLDFASDSIDAILMLEVLEHVRTPWLALAEIHRVLKPGGSLVLSAPFVFEIHEAPHDYYRFTRHGLEFLLRDFVDLEIHERGGYFTSTIVPRIRLTQSRQFPDLLIGLAFLAGALATRPLSAALDRSIKSRAATSGYVVVCCKSSSVTAS
jgi:SAM-dependent methyltransferase